MSDFERTINIAYLIASYVARLISEFRYLGRDAAARLRLNSTEAVSSQHPRDILARKLLPWNLSFISSIDQLIGKVDEWQKLFVETWLNAITALSD